MGAMSIVVISIIVLLVLYIFIDLLLTFSTCLSSLYIL